LPKQPDLNVSIRINRPQELKHLLTTPDWLICDLNNNVAYLHARPSGCAVIYLKQFNTPLSRISQDHA
jgi:hypothetical protein